MRQKETNSQKINFYPLIQGLIYNELIIMTTLKIGSAIYLIYSLIINIQFMLDIWNIIIMQNQDQRQQRTSKIVIELNKTGLSYLTHNKFGEAFQYFKQSQKIILSELRIDPHNQKNNKLAGIVYNNLACYYKKNNKPKISLIYLQKALDIQVNRVQDWAATASTHLNICAIYSYMKDHEAAASHALLSLNMLDKVSQRPLQHDNYQVNSGHQSSLKNPVTQDRTAHDKDENRSVSNLRMLSHYNLAIQLQYLKRYEQSIQEFMKAKDYAKKLGKKNLAIIMVCDQSITRMRSQMDKMKQKLIQFVTKKRNDEEKGYYSYMRKNRKNIGNRHSSNALGKKLRGLSLYEEKPYQRTNTFLRIKTSPKAQLEQLTPHNRNSSFSQL